MHTVADIQANWRKLNDRLDGDNRLLRIIAADEFPIVDGVKVEYVAPGKVARSVKKVSIAYNMVYALQLLLAAKGGTVLLVSGASPLGMWVGLFNRFALQRRAVLCWDVFVETKSKWKRKALACVYKGMTLSVLWSKAQLDPHAQWLGLPPNKFVVMPFKANHSKGPRYKLAVGGFVFSGGNDKRDYDTLVEAVRGTGIPLVISSTREEVRRRIVADSNVIVLAAAEPAFAQLQAACAFAAFAMVHTGLKGGGEANFCNAMWHGKAVVVADTMAASDYVVHGETGYVVPAGDAESLRERILELWNDPEKARGMGREARRHVSENFTHEQFIARLVRLAAILACEVNGESGGVHSGR